MKWNVTRRNNNQDSLSLFQRNIEQVFDDFFAFKPTTLFETSWLPKVDVEKNKSEITVKAEIPGIDEKELNVTLKENVLTISGEKKEEKASDKENKSIVSERFFGSFSRSITLPEGIKADKIKAKFKNGVLTLNIPVDEEKQTKKINITVQ